MPNLFFSQSYSKFSFSSKALYASYYNSTINALITVFFSIIGMFECPDGNLYTEVKCTYHWGRWYLFASTIILSYVLHDIIVIVLFVRKFDGGNISALIHHFMVIIGSSGSLYLGLMNTTIASAALITEISTPFTNLRALMAMHGLQKSHWMKIIGTLFMVSFFLSRPVMQLALIQRLYVAV